MDIWSKKKRSEVMSRIHSKNTRPETTVRSLLHKMGFRFRIHNRELPGQPDIIFSKNKALIFVHGCFWHMHKGCIDGRIPKTKATYWRAKLERNVLRDKNNIKTLKKTGWKVLVLWECETEKNIEKVTEKLLRFLSSTTIQK